MRTITRTAIGILLSFAVLSSAAAQTAGPRPGQPICGNRPQLIQELGARYAEKAAYMGLANTGSVFEVLTSKEGSWSIIATMPQGLSCLIATGKYWEGLPEPLAGIKS